MIRRGPALLRVCSSLVYTRVWRNLYLPALLMRSVIDLRVRGRCVFLAFLNTIRAAISLQALIMLFNYYAVMQAPCVYCG